MQEPSSENPKPPSAPQENPAAPDRPQRMAAGRATTTGANADQAIRAQGTAAQATRSHRQKTLLLLFDAALRRIAATARSGHAEPTLFVLDEVRH